jgi:hypothetical protein
MSIDNPACARDASKQTATVLTISAADMTRALQDSTAETLSRHITHIVRHRDAWWQQNATRTHWLLITGHDTIAFLDAHRARLEDLDKAERASSQSAPQ